MEDIKHLKEPKTFEEQIDILESRNLIIIDKENATNILSSINYYRFVAYGLHLKVEDKFKDGTTIEQLYSIYNFDKKIRNMIMALLGSVEISIRTYIAYLLAHEYGAIGYLDEKNFKNAKYHYKFVQEFYKEKRNNKKELFIKHHKKNYGNQLPIWVAVEIMSFGMVSRLYSNLQTEDKTKIANTFIGVHRDVVLSWLISLAHLRNICAHYGRLYNRVFNIVPTIHKEYINENIEEDKLFAYILALKYLVPDKKEWFKFVSDISNVIDEYKEYIELNYMGFPKNWSELLLRGL